MSPIAVIPMHDPNGVTFPHLKAITPSLKNIFSQIFVSITTITQRTLPEQIAWLETDNFFQVTRHKTNMNIGEDFLTLYAQAALACDPTQVLHLCFIDRVAFALQSDHRASFISDIQAINQDNTPLLFQRSKTAWQTHPRNYYELEQMVTKAGELLFGKSLDFACSNSLTRPAVKR